jgi:hypothetical protein
MMVGRTPKLHGLRESFAAVLLLLTGCTSAIVGETFSSDSGITEDDALDLDALPDAATPGDAGSSDASLPPCTPCVSDNGCLGQICAQFAGDSFCAQQCTPGSCGTDSACLVLTSATGNQVQVCVPIITPCGTSISFPDASTQIMGTCGALVGPSVSAACHSCTTGTGDCQANGCYGGWFCNTQTNRCQSPPSPASCGDGGAIDASRELDAGALPDGSINAAGGVLSELRFAIVGDTRPANQDDTPGYPTGIVDEIWEDVQIEHPQFAISTGDYMFAKPTGNEGNAQLDLYLGARARYAGFVYPVMGNQECTGLTSSNCGPGNADGVTNNYQAFVSRMLTPLGPVNPYYSAHFSASDGTWTAKVVVVAANAWTDAQGTFLDNELSNPSTYTFVVRHEGSSVHAPGVSPSETIIERHPLTLRLVGHTHSLYYSTTNKELVVGNGGAPLSSSVNYGYVIAERRSDGAIAFYAIDYATRSVFFDLAVQADGTLVP